MMKKNGGGATIPAVIISNPVQVTKKTAVDTINKAKTESNKNYNVADAIIGIQQNNLLRKKLSKNTLGMGQTV